MTIGIIVLVGLAVLAGIYFVLHSEGAKKGPARDRADPEEPP